jgi:hypothetical protein
VSLLGRWRKGQSRTPAELDRLSLKHLEKRGADLARPRHIIHFLYFESEADARRACEDVPAGGWDATVVPPEEPRTRWVVRGEATRMVDARTVESYRAWFEQIAEEHHGEYDGWEASVKP